MDTKVCPKCNIEKLITEFTKCAKSLDKHYYCCRDCKNKSKNKNGKYKENPETVRIRSKRNREKNLNYYREYSKEYYKNNLDYLREYNKELNRKKPHLAKERKRRWRKSGKNAIACHKRRAIIMDIRHGFTIKDWESCLEYFINSCSYCGEIGVPLQQEHVIPVSKGGTYTPDNIIPACPSCNYKKATKTMEEWFKKQPFFSFEKLEKIKKWILINSDFNCVTAH